MKKMIINEENKKSLLMYCDTLLKTNEETKNSMMELIGICHLAIKQSKTEEEKKFFEDCINRLMGAL